MSNKKLELFPHQKEALNKMNSFYKKLDNPYAGLVVIPTGGGKTFTAVRWIHDQLVKRTVKVIWLAQSFELLNQAYASFIYDERNSKEQFNMRIISSNSQHSSIDKITNADDIVIVTTQTAIHSMKQKDNNLIRFINDNSDAGLIVILDEAHHAPAYGCRKLLLKLKQDVPNLWLLGLTATPTYTNAGRRGWLWTIFDGGVIYEVEKQLLQQQHILARENIIKKKTPMKIEVSNEVFDQLMRQHRDIPENIIELIASNTERNNFIINDYLNNKAFYGKTIMFLDRWFQCLYVKEKLIENGIITDAIFCQNNTDPQVLSGQKQSNKQIVDGFRSDRLDVLLNVKMLTEGTDVPDVNTVFITRDTTSHILLQQMIGRALRGERAGGKKVVANIVLFGDNWDKTIAWAEPERQGDIDDSRIKQIAMPSEKISINLMEQLVKSMTFNSVYVPDFLDLIPIGWYQVEYVSYFGGEESLEVIKDVVLVYQQTKELLKSFISRSIGNLPERWALEEIDTHFINKETDNIISKYFDVLGPAFAKELRNGIPSLCRHIAQNNSEPRFFEFTNRNDFDLEKIANQLIELTPLAQYNFLNNEYNKPGSIWPHLYMQFYHFKSAADMYVNKILFKLSNGSEYGIPIPSENHEQVLQAANSKEQIKAVKFRDNNTCLCCGLTSKETKLEISEILPAHFVGQSTIKNLLTLCTRCNRLKTNGIINFYNQRTALANPKPFEGVAFDKRYRKDIPRIKATIRGSINIFFECGAVYDILLSRRKNSSHYSKWTIILYSGNSIDWMDTIKSKLLHFIRVTLMQDHVVDVKYKTIM
ncbi:DEAD/DEAH box helicase family protein [Desulfosporosinus sp.]|uniref:DEAD/DEAH box helicase family protein n=1 Tax=Desulfosporosinus sp. TaxID=157907 RepID=UPI002618B323|nr:DEAD/DEAH box helicase family protein [Desulfosporosinus sp.]